jgi:hypothetical protein
VPEQHRAAHDHGATHTHPTKHVDAFASFPADEIYLRLSDIAQRMTMALHPHQTLNKSHCCLACVCADEINLRLSSIAQRMTMALQLIPIQKAKVSDARLQELSHLQGEIRCAQFAAARAAEEQSAQLKRLMDQSKVDASKTQEMLSQVCFEYVILLCYFVILLCNQQVTTLCCFLLHLGCRCWSCWGRCHDAASCSSSSSSSSSRTPACFLSAGRIVMFAICMQVLELLQADVEMRQAAAAAGPLPATSGGPGGGS